jgi:hypothetical protein
LAHAVFCPNGKESESKVVVVVGSFVEWSVGWPAGLYSLHFLYYICYPVILDVCVVFVVCVVIVEPGVGADSTRIFSPIRTPYVNRIRLAMQRRLI